MSTNDVCSGVIWKKRAMRPIISTPCTGQKRSSKMRNTLREAIWRFRRAKAPTAAASTRKLNEDLLQLRLAHLDVPDHGALGLDGREDRGQALLRFVHRARDPVAGDDAAEHALH